MPLYLSVACPDQAGAPSTGKTTFIQNFASSCSHQGDADFGAPAVSSAQQLRLPHTLSSADFIESFSTEPTRAEEFKANSDNLCTRVTLIDEAAKIQYHVTIQVVCSLALSTVVHMTDISLQTLKGLQH